MIPLINHFQQSMLFGKATAPKESPDLVGAQFIGI